MTPSPDHYQNLVSSRNLPPQRVMLLRDLLLGTPVATSADWNSETHAGPGRASVQPTLCNATFTAWERIQHLCAEEVVDLLVLCGNTFVEADESVAARVALHEGLWKLHETGTTVIVLPAEADPASAWRSVPDLPPSVNVIPSGLQHLRRIELQTGAVVAVGSEDAFAAEVDSDDNAKVDLCITLTPESQFPVEDVTNGLQIPTRSQVSGGVSQRSGRSNRTHSASSIPSPQPIANHDGGAGSVLVYQVEQNQIASSEHFTVGPVRRETFAIAPEAFATPDRLVESLWERIEAATPHENELLWLITWNVPLESVPGWLAETDLLVQLDQALDRDRVIFQHHFDLPEQNGVIAFDPESELGTVCEATLQRINDPALYRQVMNEAESIDESTPEWSVVPSGSVTAKARELARIWMTPSDRAAG